MGIFLHGYFRPFIFFRVPIVFALAPPMGSGTMRAGPWPGPHGHISGIPLLLSIPEQRRLSYAQAVLGVSLFEPFHLLSGLPGPTAGWIARRPLGPGLGARCGVGTAACYPHCWYALFKEQRRGRHSPFRCPCRKRGWGEYPHAANFSKYFFMSRRIRSLRLMTARWVTPIRRAYSLVERRCDKTAR